MIVDAIFVVYGTAFILIALPGVYFAWRTRISGSANTRWFQQWIIPFAALLLLAGGWWTSHELGKKADLEGREMLIANVSSVALTINTEWAQQLSFTADDKHSPAFQRMTKQLKASAQTTQLRYVYSIAERDGKFVFGPESLEEYDPLASPPGTVYEYPPEELTVVFKEARSLTTGVYTDEYGSFITALVPVINPVDSRVLMVVGTDIDAQVWGATMIHARALPLFVSLLLLTALMVGNGLLGWRHTLPSKRYMRWRYIEAVLCAFTGLVLTIAIAWLLYGSEQQARYQSYSALARAHAGAVTESMFNMRNRLKSLGSLFETSDTVDLKEFQRFAAILARDGLSQSWEWARVVPADSLEKINEDAHAQGVDNFVVWERTKDRERIPAASRDVYYPVFYVAPESGNEMVYGYDVGSESVRLEALQETIATGMATGTDPIILVQEAGERKGLLVFQPVYRHEELYGFALLTFQFFPMLQRAIAQAGRQESGIVVNLFQIMPDKSPVFLASSSKKTVTGKFFEHCRSEDLCVRVPLSVFGKSYALVMHPEPSWIVAHPLWIGRSVLLAGILITIVLTAFVASLTNRRTFLAFEVAERTADLQESEKQLSNERTKLRRILDSLPNGVYLVTKDYDVRYLNPALEEMFGKHGGQKCYEYIHNFSAPCEWCVSDRVFAGESVKWECTECKPGRIYEVCEAPVTDSDGTPCKLAAFYDITEIKASQEALRLNEARIAATLNSIGDGVISTDISGTVVGINLAASHLTGWKAEDACGRLISEVFDIINGNTGEKAIIPIWKTLEEGIVVELANHTILINRDGSRRHIADSCAPIRLSTGEVIGAVLVFRDVTNEYHTRRELAISNDRFKQTAAQSREIIWEVDITGLYTYVSAAVFDILGYTPEEVIGKIYYYDLHPDQGRESFKEKAKKILAKQRQFKGFENRCIHKDGHVITLLANGLPMLDSEGKVIGYRGSSQDITERKKMETELVESKRHLANILDSVEDVIWSASPFPHLELQYMTPATMRLYGRPVEEFYENPILWAEVILPEDGVVIEGIWETLKNTGTVEIEYRIMRPDASTCWVRDRRKCIYDEHNTVIRIDGILSDITTRKIIEEALRESEATYRVLFEGSRDAMVIYDVAAEKFTAANSAALAMFKVKTLQEFRQMGPLDLSSETQPDGSVSATKSYGFIGMAMEEGAHYFEWVHRRTDGTEFPATVMLNKLTLDNRVLLQATIRDVTKEKEAEQELKLSREQYMLAVNGANDGIFDWDLRTGSLYLSAQWKKMIGYKEEELQNCFETFDERIHPDDKPRVVGYIEEYLQGKIKNYAIEFRFRHKNGHYIWVLARGEALRDEQGIPFRMAGSHSDITERKEAEERLRDSEARINTVLNAAQDAIIMIDGEGNISLWNAAAERIFGYDKDDVFGKNLHKLLAPTHYHKDHANAFSLFQKTGEGSAVGKVIELSAIDSKNREFPIELSLSSLQLGGQWHAVGIVRDITARKKAEEDILRSNRRLEEAIKLANEMAAAAEMANAAKSAFLANVSHEIRTPMNGIIGMTSLLLDTNLSRIQRHNAEVIRESSESLLWLINDILDFSKIEAGKLEIENIDFDLHSLLDDFSILLAVKAQEKEIEFVCAAAPETPALLRGDPGRIRQILTNLAGNAIKFTEQGEVVVRVSLVEQNDEGALLHFSVKDTGIGIPADKMDTLFESFTQVDSSTTRKYGGTGLGLAITKQLVELMEGEIGFSSEEGSGSEFWFEVRLPVREEEVEETAPSVDLRGVRALVVDDNATNREMLCAQLAALGIMPDESPDGITALEMLRQARRSGQAYNLAILDMLMPGLDGEALGKEICSDEGLKDTAMVMMTSIGRRGDARRLEDIGFAAYLTKPVRQSDLFDCLSIALAQSNEEKNAARSKGKHAIVTRHSVRELRKYHARVLLAEDNLINQQVAMGLLKKFNISVEVANNGQQALNALKSGHFDLVLMDVQMPEMDGFEATHIIRNSSPVVINPNIPIIAMTAHTAQEDRNRCTKAGMNDYLSKPLDPELLLEMLKKWLPEKKKVKQNSLTPKIKEESTTPDTVFDREGMMSRLMGDEHLAQVLISTFLSDMPNQFETLEQYLAANDCEGATRQAHTIKGAAANLGAIALSHTAAAIEKAGKSGDCEKMKTMLPELEKQFALTEQSMEET